MASIKLTQTPIRGDAVLGVLATGEQVFATHESMMQATLDESVYEYIGPVLDVRGNEVLFCYHTAVLQAWCTRYFFKLTGYTLDGTARTGVLQIYEASNNWASKVNYTVSYNASTVDAMVTQLNTFFADTTNTVFQTQDWYAKKEEDNSIVLHCDFTNAAQRNNSGSSGFGLTEQTLPNVASITVARRRNGYGDASSGVIMQWERVHSYFRNDVDVTIYNPSSDVTSIQRQQVICLPAYLGTSQYQSDHCAYLRSVYGEGEEGWTRFMESCLPVYPTDGGCYGVRNGKERTEQLAAETYTSHSVTTPTPYCNAAAYCANVETQTMPKGSFWLPTVEELYRTLKGIQYNIDWHKDSDVVTELQFRMNKTLLSNGTSYYACTRSSSYTAHYVYGSRGTLSGSVFLATRYAIPVSIIELD